MNHDYRCLYPLGTGELRFSVKDLDREAPGRAYFHHLRATLPGATDLGSLESYGLPGFETRSGSVVLIKDHKTLWVDATDVDAAELVRAPRAAALLQGYRGQPAVDMAGLEQALIRLAKLASDHPEITEVDLNPVIARPDGLVAVDARVRLQHQPPSDPFLRRLR